MEASSLTSGQIADLLDGRLVGRANIQLAGVAPLESARSGDLSFLSSTSHLEQFRNSRAGAVLLPPDLADAHPGPETRIVVNDVRVALARAVAAILPQSEVSWGVSPTASIGRGSTWSGRIAVAEGARIGQNAKFGSDCVLGRFAVVEDGVKLGDECRIGAHAAVCANAKLGDRVVLKTGARVGGTGYSYATKEDGHIPIPHIGGCYLEDDVEVGANTTIDRGSVGDTVIGAGTKIDNLVQIAHNVRIGRRCLIMAQSGLAGSTVLEDDVMLAGQAGLAGHLTVGRGARVAAQGGVIGDIPPGETVSGYPARRHRDVLRQTAALRTLAQITKALERIVESDENL